MSLGIVTVVACVALLAAAETGCAAKPERAVEASTKSVALEPPAVQLPARPRPYAVPAGARAVSSSRELVAALADGRREAIVLAPGTYDNPKPFADREGDRLYAARLGTAVFKAGVVLGANSGPPGASIRGLSFDVSDPAKTLNGAIVHVWGSASHASVRDTRLDGNRRVETGLLVRQAQGFVGRRIVASRFRSYGVVVDPNDVGYRTRSPFALSDLTISRVRRPVQGSSDGRAEACLWLGSPGTVPPSRRPQVRHHRHLDRNRDAGLSRCRRDDRSRAGRHLHRALHDEHDLRAPASRAERRPRRERGVVGPLARAEAGEQRQRDPGRLLPNSRTSVSTSTRARPARSSVAVCFVGQSWAAIGDYLGQGNGYYENDFSGIRSGAVAVSHDHAPPGAKRP